MKSFISVIKKLLRIGAGVLNGILCGFPPVGIYLLKKPSGYISIFTLIEAGLAKEYSSSSDKQEGHVYEIKNGIVFSDYGYILIDISGKIYIVRELSVPLNDLDFEDHYFHWKYSWRYFNRIRRARGGIAVVNSTASSHNYYHWLIEALPRIGLLEKTGMTPDLYFMSDSKKYQRDSLETLKIPAEKIISPSINTCIIADRLLVPSLLFHCTESKKEDYLDKLPSWTGDWLCSKFLPQTQGNAHEKLYISRKSTCARRIRNESELIENLSRYGVRAVKLEDLDITSQGKLFHGADFIISPHGAALANIVFCNPGTKVIDFMPANRVRSFFRHIAYNRRLEYKEILLEPINDHDDLVVNISMLENFFNNS